jgi:hypothetical protein
LAKAQKAVNDQAERLRNPSDLLTEASGAINSAIEKSELVIGKLTH